MTDTLFPKAEEGTPSVALGSTLMTVLGLVEGDALTYLEEQGSTTLRRLIRELDWPATLVTMAVGALIRQGLARGVRHELEIIIEPRRKRRLPRG